MPTAIRILLVEDSQEDAELTLLNLRTQGITFTHTVVDSMPDFLAALNDGPWDLVISDFSLPGTDGMELLKALRSTDRDLPFILLSGVLDECAAVNSMRSGANDFLIKGNLSRLVPAIEREMKEADLRRKQRMFEEELRLLHMAIGQTPDMVLITDREGTIRYTNAAVEVITGYRREELLGQNPRLFKSDSHDAPFYRSMWEALLRGEIWKGHIVNRRKDGSLWDAESVISPIFDTRGELQNYLCTSRDITQELKLKSLLEQAQRLETIGTLTSGIAHDFNNILMPVIGHAELGLERPAGDPRLKHDLEVILASANRAGNLIRQILTFSRKGEQEPVPVEVQSLLAESLKLLRATIPSSISFAVELEARDRFALVDPTKLHQVILNLCTNAGHAMRGTAGRLTVGLRPMDLPATECAMNIHLPAGTYLCLEVTDTGRGISPEHLDKIFLPFFSTKAPHEGTGLGLSVTHGIVSAAKGGIQVSSQPEVGTTFNVLLPLTGNPAVSHDELAGACPEGQGRILLVDDEESLLDMLQASLMDMGFGVSAFLQPASALRAFLQNPDAFQLLLTDLTMPQMSGVQLAEAIWAQRPAFPVILLSGTLDPEQTLAPHGIERFRACLTKPLSRKELGWAILNAVPEMNRHAPAIRL